MDKILTPTVKAVLASYGRAALASVVALYMSGVTDWHVLVNAAIASILAPLAKALSPKDTTFGVNAKK